MLHCFQQKHAKAAVFSLSISFDQSVYSNKRAGVFNGIKHDIRGRQLFVELELTLTLRHNSMKITLLLVNLTFEFIELLQKHFTKLGVSLWSPDNNYTKCDRKILAYKKNMPGHLT